MRFVEVSHEERPCSPGAADLVEDGRTGAKHPGSVAGLGCDVERELDRPASEFVPSRPIECPTVVELDEAPVGRRFTLIRCIRRMRVARLVS